MKPYKEPSRVISPHNAANLFYEDMKNLDHEEVWVLFLSCQQTVIAKEMLSKGTLSQTAIDSRTILRRALLNNAASIIIAHNHPSGNPRPSEADIKQTENFREACMIMNILMVDHIIITDEFFYSFTEGTVLAVC